MLAARNEAEDARKVAEDANAAKSNFLAVITHEIRTPMNAVVSSLNFLRRTPLNDEQKGPPRHAGKRVGRSAGPAQRRARPVAHRSWQDAPRTRLRKPGRDAEKPGIAVPAPGPRKGPDFARRHRARSAGHGRHRSAAPAPDPVQPVSNAVKFTEHGLISLRVKALDGCLVFEVEDQGIGIAEGRPRTHLSSFEQAEAATTRRYGGTGLGLAISRRLAG
ncbi:MAG: ATP-binding protein [Asticcacaulis sp.]